MIRPRVVSDAIVDGIIRVAGAFCSELPYCPVFAVFGIEKRDELVEWIPVGELWVLLRGPRTVLGSN